MCRSCKTGCRPHRLKQIHGAPHAPLPKPSHGSTVPRRVERHHSHARDPHPALPLTPSTSAGEGPRHHMGAQGRAETKGPAARPPTPPHQNPTQDFALTGCECTSPPPDSRSLPAPAGRASREGTGTFPTPTAGPPSDTGTQLASRSPGADGKLAPTSPRHPRGPQRQPPLQLHLEQRHGPPTNI